MEQCKFNELSDKQKILMSVLARVEFNNSDTGKTIAELLENDNKILAAISDFEKTNDEGKIDKERAKMLLGSMIHLKLISVCDFNHGKGNGFYGLTFEDSEAQTGFVFRGTEEFTQSPSKLMGKGAIDQTDNIIYALSENSNQTESARKFFLRHAGKSNYLYGFSKGGNLVLSILRDYLNLVSQCFVVNPFSIKADGLPQEVRDKLDIIIGLGDPVHLIRNMGPLSSRMRYAQVKRSHGGFGTAHSLENIKFANDGAIEEETDSKKIRRSERTIASRLLKTVNYLLEKLDSNILKRSRVLKIYSEFTGYYNEREMSETLIEAGYPINNASNIKEMYDRYMSRKDDRFI